MSRLRRRLLAAFLTAGCLSPAAAIAQDQCRAIRGLTNMDGRRFADLAVGFAANPWRMSVRVGRTEALPTPEDCGLSAAGDEVELSCYWRPGDYAATSALFSSLFARFQSCLGNALAAPAGPRPYGGNATALQESITTLASAGGETGVGLRLIEAPEGTTPAHHYVVLSIDYEPREPDEAE